ncbi:MAG: ornithine cyclodeaminase family protein [Candidatus Thorarchaeota archaeon]
MQDILIISQNEAEKCLPMKDAIEAVKTAYIAFSAGRVQMPPVVHLDVKMYNGEVDIKSGYIEDLNLIGTKIASGYYDNHKLGLPPGIGVIVLLDLKTSMPLAIMDGTYITASRTGAAGAIAASLLARKESKTVGVVGAGTQGRMQVLGLKEFFSIERVNVWDIDDASKKRYEKTMPDILNAEVKAMDSVEEVVKNADIIVTVTPSRKALVMAEWIGDGVHINAIGADGKGKQELDPKIMKKASKIVVDSLDQCKVIGELQHAFGQGIISEENVHAEIGDILSGKKTGRETQDEITVFDSTGLAAQDIAAASVVFQLAQKRGLGKSIKLLDF